MLGVHIKTLTWRQRSEDLLRQDAGELIRRCAQRLAGVSPLRLQLSDCALVVRRRAGQHLHGGAGVSGFPLRANDASFWAQQPMRRYCDAKAVTCEAGGKRSLSAS